MGLTPLGHSEECCDESLDVTLGHSEECCDESLDLTSIGHSEECYNESLGKMLGQKNQRVRSLLLCPLSVERYYFSLCGDSEQSKHKNVFFKSDNTKHLGNFWRSSLSNRQACKCNSYSDNEEIKRR